MKMCIKTIEFAELWHMPVFGILCLSRFLLGFLDLYYGIRYNKTSETRLITGNRLTQL